MITRNPVMSSLLLKLLQVLLLHLLHMLFELELLPGILSIQNHLQRNSLMGEGWDDPEVEVVWCCFWHKMCQEQMPKSNCECG